MDAITLTASAVSANDGFSSVRYVDVARPAAGEMRAVAPGVWWLRFPLPFRLNHVNIWVLDDGEDAVTVIDAGLGDQPSKDLWEKILSGPLAGKKINRIIATHYHPDHIGLCGWLMEKTGAVFASGLADWLYARVLAEPQTPAAEAAAELFYRRAGADAGLTDYALGRGGAYRSLVGPIPTTLERLRVGDELTIGGRDWRVVHTAGHTPEPISLYCAELNVLIVGDQVLPRISPNISVTPGEPEADPLADFLSSFDDLRRLPVDVLTLPSHDAPYYGLHARLDQLETLHADRLADIAELCRRPMNARPMDAWRLMEATFSAGLDTHQQMFALGETVAHLNRLRRLGRIRRDLGANGVYLYAAV